MSWFIPTVLGGSLGTLLYFFGVPETWYGFLSLATLSGLGFMSLVTAITDQFPVADDEGSRIIEDRQYWAYLGLIFLTIISGSIAVTFGATALYTFIAIILVQAVCSLIAVHGMR